MNRRQKRWDAFKQWVRPLDSWTVIEDGHLFSALTRVGEVAWDATVHIELLETEVGVSYDGREEREENCEIEFGQKTHLNVAETRFQFVIPLFPKGELIWTTLSIANFRQLLWGPPTQSSIDPCLKALVKKGEGFRARADKYKN